MLEGASLRVASPPELTFQLPPLMLATGDVHSNVRTLLLILASLPVSVASAEHTFSTLLRSKTWLRAKTTEERLAGMALLNIRRGIRVACTASRTGLRVQGARGQNFFSKGFTRSCNVKKVANGSLCYSPIFVRRCN